jgi:hypothetical protein
MTKRLYGEGLPKCGGKLRGGKDGTCTRPAGWGTDHVGIGACKLHGGNTRNHKTHAELVQAQHAVELWGGRREVHPAQALLELVQWKAAEVEYWRHRVDTLENYELTWSLTKKVEGYGEDGLLNSTTREAKPHIALIQLHEAEAKLADYCTASLRAGCDQALVQVAQARAVIWLGAMRSMLADERVSVAGDPEQVIFDALRELTAV